MSNKLIMYDGAELKSVPISQLPDSAWTWYTPHLTDEDENLKRYYRAVPWLFRGVDMRAGDVASLPFAIMRGETEVDSSREWQNVVECLPDPWSLLRLIESALTIMGRAYLFNLRNSVKTLGLDYLLPTSVEPAWDKDAQTPSAALAGFIRRVGAKTVGLDIEDVVYFWYPDTYVEVGPPAQSPATAALAAAGVLFNIDEFATAFFARGAIKATMLTVEGTPPPGEKERIEKWWNKFFRGIGNAFQMKVFRADAVKPVQVGEGVKELSDSELIKEKREDISTALGIPQSILWSSQASGLGGAGVATADDKRYWKGTIMPEALFIQRTLNQQVFDRMGYQFKFLFDTIDAFQEDEAARGQALGYYVNAGMPLECAGPMLGLELPEGWSWEQIAADKEERRQEMAQAMQQGPQDDKPDPFQEKDEAKALMVEDLRRWAKKSRKRGEIAPFESDHIPEGMAEIIAAGDVGVFTFLKAIDTLEAEKRIQAKVKKILEKHLKRISLVIRNNGNVDYQPLIDDLQAALGPEISGIAVEQALRVAAEIGVQFDPALVNEAALRWANEYSYELISGLTNTTRNAVSRAVEQFVGTPGMTRGDLEKLLQPAFGEARASMIAVTETTRAYAEATNQYQRDIATAGIEMTRIWNTNNDGLVCPICGPLNQKPEKVWSNDFPDGPPAHVNCRCWLELRA